MRERSRSPGPTLVIPLGMTDPRIAWAVAEMGRRMGDGITVGELARAANLSQSRFAHLFHQQVGISPGRYLRRRRLERARLLLQSTFLSVKEVMAAVGYNDPSHFSRDFQRAYGASPRAWRERIARPPPDPELAILANK
jgi:AraC family transcriptional regulator, arabinose operon regulatory protein